MRYYHLTGFSGVDALRLDERRVPVPGPREVLVRMRAWSLNHRDLMIADGRYGRGMKPDVVPLSDGAGEVVDAGSEVTRWKPGDRVTSVFLPRWISGPADAARTAGALGGPVDGVLAEYVAFDQDALVATPSHLEDAEACTLPCAAVTAWHALVVYGGIVPGQSVLTLGSGGVSVFALQFAVLAGAEVTVTSSSDAKLERLLAMGAVAGVNYSRTPEWGKHIQRMTNGGVDHVVEVGGPGTLPQSVRAVRAGGRVSVIGVLSQGPGIDPVQLLRRAVTVQGMQVGSRETFEAMNRAVELHRIRPVIDHAFAFSDAGAAYRRLESGGHFGKVVIAAD
ncbi:MULTISPECIES: NAD(P)-dependent alcohol dehydrogenase [unclassified Streptomyces]|uniref:zinc-dependent alcohol dehydrogenase family protein n=1 Tax=unclassified Streptomyces TaxID=2593676 RepID=UPI002258F0EB|nr:MULTISPECIES: NAD(P)-dependent alcohol dehydrogenase [unclassified Streptomyces]MCX4970650.1 NAD(P)-dependent alcohol dehydrogenase [Streptomyces sp. NBC_00654]MEE1736290.1 NAD(P)-dependent alcohol dehydrogenase [Streptomyces sp. BE147]